MPELRLANLGDVRTDFTHASCRSLQWPWHGVLETNANGPGIVTSGLVAGAARQTKTDSFDALYPQFPYESTSRVGESMCEVFEKRCGRAPKGAAVIESTEPPAGPAKRGHEDALAAPLVSLIGTEAAVAIAVEVCDPNTVQADNEV